MKKNWIAVLVLASLLLTMNAYAEGATKDEAAEVIPTATPAPAEEEAETEEAEAPVSEAFEIVTRWRSFVNSHKYRREVKVSYYDNVYAVNHGKYGLQPFASTVPAEYFVEDESGALALAPIVLDITDEMRIRLYGSDVGETALFYGQYCERARAKDKQTGFTGIHEGIDFINKKGSPLHAILGGEVTRAGDSNGTVGIYNEELDITLLYLHCEDIEVKRGMKLEAGDEIAKEGRKKSGSYYTDVEFRYGRHTSSSPYRDTKLTSDCPYPVLEKALDIVPSGRQPITAAAVMEAQRMREEAEAKAKAEAEAAEEAARQEAEEDVVDVELVDNLPGAQEGYGFSTELPEPTRTPAPEATLPPAGGK